MDNKDFIDMMCDYELYKETFKEDKNDPFIYSRKERGKSGVGAVSVLVAIAVLVLLLLK